MKTKSGKIPIIKTLVIIFTITTISISTFILIYSLNTLEINDDKARMQIAFDRLFRHCLSDDFGRFNPENFNQDSLDSCMSGIDDNFHLRIISPDGKTIVYLRNERERFLEYRQFCFVQSSITCSQIVSPILVQIDGEEFVMTITLEVILS